MLSNAGMLIGFDDAHGPIAMARIVLGPDMNIQAPSNLSHDGFADQIGAGLNERGGVLPGTPDHVDSEAARRQIDSLPQVTRREDRVLVDRPASYPAFVSPQRVAHWGDRRLVAPILRSIDATGFVGTAGRVPRQRTTLYGKPAAKQVQRSFGAPPISPKTDIPPRRALPSRMAGSVLAQEFGSAAYASGDGCR